MPFAARASASPLVIRHMAHVGDPYGGDPYDGKTHTGLIDDDSVHDGFVGGSSSELDHHMAARVGGRRERVLDGDVLPPGVGKDVEVGQDLVAVDDHVEQALSGGRPEVLHEV